MAVLLFQMANAQSLRYVNTIFSQTQKHADVIYGSADFLNSPYVDESITSTGNLIMDIYEPFGDTLTKRPAIIFAHGGGFFDGSRNVDDMEAFCDTFARKGYVTATIDYRQGVQVNDNADLHYTRAAYRGLQDGRTAIRFLRANAAAYGIDPNHIYWGGNSAGSFIGLLSIYMDDVEKPGFANEVDYSVEVTDPFGGVQFVDYTGPDLGNLDIGNNLTYSGEPNAVMACWGGIGDTNFIQTDNNQPVFLIHGTADDIVPFNSGPPFNLTNVSAVFGSNPINTRLNNLGITDKLTYFVEGEGHEFYGVTNGNWTNNGRGNAYWDTVVQKATSFYFDQHKPIADFSAWIGGLTVEFTSNSSGATKWLYDFGDGNNSISQNPEHTYANSGSYTVFLYVENDMQSWDTVTKVITVGNANPVEDIAVLEVKPILKDFSDTNHITASIQNSGDTSASNFELKLDVNGTVYTETFADTLLASESALYTFSQDLDFATEGIYHIKVISQLTADTNMTNDTAQNVINSYKGRNALTFDGTNDRVVVKDNDIGNPLTQFTLSLWVKLFSYPSGNYALISKHNNVGSRKGFTIEYGNTVKGVLANATNGWSVVESPDSWELNEWHHVAFTFDFPKLKIYDNGIAVDSMTILSYVYSSINLGLGNSVAYDNYLNGAIDEVMIWDTVRSQSDIIKDMNGKTNIPQQHLIAYYKFNQGRDKADNTTINTLVDETDNNNHGAIYNMDLSNGSAVSNFVKSEYEVEYLAGPNGNITGETNQLVREGKHASEVLATPDTGYDFYQWSDGQMDNPRQDSSITADISVTATFDVIDAISNNSSNTSEIDVYPIPASDNITIDAQNMAVSEIEIINSLGKTVIYNNAGLQKIDVSHLPKGLYFIKVKSKNSTSIKKINIQ
jgi:PKD repeat protein